MAAQEWMEAVTGKRFTNGDLWETLKSGVYLCTLLNKVKPGTVTGKIKESRMPFTCMELISKYIEGCKKLGIRDGNCFRPPDLYEKRVSYPKAIINNIHGLARVAEDIRGFRGPKLEVESIAGHSSW
jgi:transgelin